MTEKLNETIKLLEKQTISNERKAILSDFTKHLKSKIDDNEIINVIFICTHNSRRSILGQVWFQVLSNHFEFKNMFSYSGGTESTKIAEPIIKTLKHQGIDINIIAKTDNPIYAIKYNENHPAIIGFSKEFSHSFNPQSDFTAVMVCSDADKNCPFIKTANKQIAITYEDPKLFDNTNQEDEKYLERSLEIGSELFFVFSELRK